MFDCSRSFQGHALNEYWAKGPDAFINNLFEIFIRFREDYVGYVGDIRKYYNSVMMSVFDQHCHRFLYRPSWWLKNKEEPPDVNCITVVNMGDRPSGAIATVALYKTAELSASIYPEEAKVIKDSSYVDDIADSKYNKKNADCIIENINDILKTGNFTIKRWIISGDTDPNYSEKVLGVNWQPYNDVLWLPIKINFSAMKDGVRTEPNVTITNIREFQN